MNDKNYAKKVAIYGMLIALAMILSFVETMIPLSLGIPGVKLGLANLVTIVCIYIMGIPAAWMVSILRIVLVGFTFGNMFAMLYSLAGGVFSLLCMTLVKKSGLLSMSGVSIVGGVTHNIGQISVAALVVNTAGVFYYLPVLMIAGIVTGTIIGILASMVIKRIKPMIKKEAEVEYD